MTTTARPFLGILLAGTLLAPAARSAAQPGGDGLDWATVGSPGNRPTNGSEAMFPMGSVPYAYRMTRTEVTVEQWFEFLQAYAPFNAGSPSDSALTSIWIRYTPGVGYSYDPARARFAVDISWENGARLCNWLENGKVSQASAFSSGVYDTSTFTFNSDHSPNHNYTHAPGARYWIPSLDEWIKATYYDPNRHGLDLDGYWMYPNRSDDPPIGGLPGTGATTNAEMPLSEALMPVGQYPNAPSPWGLLDTSGGLSEWTSTDDRTHGRNLLQLCSGAGQWDIRYVDALAMASIYTNYPGGTLGLRLASQVPAPGGLTAIFLFVSVALRRTRR